MEPLRIVIVEDQALISMMLEGMLVEMGHQVCAVAADEADAVLAADLHHPDLIIVDMELRGGNGVAAMQKIQRDHPVPHFFTSGDPVAVKSCSPDAVVVAKPYRMAMLARAIEAATAAARAL